MLLSVDPQTTLFFSVLLFTHLPFQDSGSAALIARFVKTVHHLSPVCARKGKIVYCLHRLAAHSAARSISDSSGLLPGETRQPFLRVWEQVRLLQLQSRAWSITPFSETETKTDEDASG